MSIFFVGTWLYLPPCIVLITVITQSCFFCSGGRKRPDWELSSVSGDLENVIDQSSFFTVEDVKDLIGNCRVIQEIMKPTTKKILIPEKLQNMPWRCHPKIRSMFLNLHLFGFTLGEA